MEELPRKMTGRRPIPSLMGPFLHSVYLPAVREAMLRLPEVEEYLCHGTPAFRVGKKLLARIREDGETLAVHTPDRDPWMALDSKVFFITDHYRNYSYVLVRLPVVRKEILWQVLFEAWQDAAPKRALKAFDGGATTG